MATMQKKATIKVLVQVLAWVFQKMARRQKTRGYSVSWLWKCVYDQQFRVQGADDS